MRSKPNNSNFYRRNTAIQRQKLSKIAMEALNDEPDVAVIVTDMKMPGKTGAEMIEAVWAGVSPGMKFAVISGHGEYSTQTTNVVAGKVCPFLRKPVNISDLIETVTTVLGQAIAARCFAGIQSVLYYFPDCSASQTEERTYPFAESFGDILQRHSADLIGIAVGN